MKTNEELCTLKEEFETLEKKLHELNEEELEQVSGGSTGQSATEYRLSTDGNGLWTENETVVQSITVSGRNRPYPDSEMIYLDISNNQRLVKAIPNQGYAFQSCSFDAGTNTYEATFTCVER